MVAHWFFFEPPRKIKKMKIDLHVHIANIDAFLKTSDSIPPFRKRLCRALRKTANKYIEPSECASAIEQLLNRLAGWVRQSQLDKAVLLALDSVYDESGAKDPANTVLNVENAFVRNAAKGKPEFLFGASIHPYRKDAVQELERAVKQGACLVKWIPSAQHILPDSPKCCPIFEAMAHYKIPLLTHTGMEHTLGSKRTDFNHPKRLIPALKMGVNVIAAHCGARLFLHEPCYFKNWSFLAKEHENLYGDLSAFAIMTRVPYLRRMLTDKVLREKIFYGSDFPGEPPPLGCWQLGFRQIRKIAKIENPLERNVQMMQVLELPTEAFERAEKVICPQAKS